MKSSLKVLIIIVLLISGIGLYSRFIATKGLEVKEYKVVNNKINESFYGLKVVHLSDIHYGSTINSSDLKKIVKRVNLVKPDIIVLTGDLIDDKRTYDSKELIEILNELEATLGKYAISGNHDLPKETWENIITEIGFINLDDTYELVYKNNQTPILISGISSNYMGGELSLKTKELDDYLNTLEEQFESIYSILLLHEPDYIDDLNLSNYDLALAGHSHGGQVKLPLIDNLYTPNGAKKYYNAYYKVNETDLYISSGLGTSKIKVRLFNKPSFNLYRLTNS